MTRVSPLLPTFARGEVSQLMFGRSDIDAYASCLEKCRNCWVRPYGVVSRIVGTEYIYTAKGKARLLKFVFSSTDSYIIECGAGYFRFYRDGAYIVNENGEIYEISNPFTQTQLETIQYIQLDDIIKIVYQDDTSNTNKPLELIRRASNDWLLKEVDFKCSPFLDQNVTDVTLTPSADNGTITLTASADTFNQGHVGSFWSIGELTTVDNLEKQGFVKITAVTDATHATAVVQHKLSTTSATKTWREGAWSTFRGYPSAIGIFEGRLYYGRTPTSPRNVYGSRPYAYEDFTPATANEKNGAINVELATNAGGDGSAIQWIVGSNSLVIGTFGSEFIISGGSSGITPTDISAKARTNWGSERIQPPTMGSLIYFVQRTGRKIRQFSYDYYLDTYKGIDVSLYSEHLLESPIVQIAYQKSPDALLWCIRQDGKIALLTIEIDQQVQAWSLLEFDGVVESIETIPSFNGLYDEVYLIVRREIDGQTVRHIERMQDLITPENQNKCWYVRDGLCFSAFDLTIGNSLTLSATTGTVTITSQSGFFSAQNIQKRIRMIDDDMNLIGEAIILDVISETKVSAFVVKEFSTTNISGGKWGTSVQNISGLSHLEGKDVSVLADGAVQTKQTVEDGQILLERDAFYIIIGLPYQSYFKTMPIEVGSQYGTALGKKKRIHEVAMRVWRTSGSRVGYDLNHLQTVMFRNPLIPMGEAQPVFTGIVPNIKYNQGWTYEASITVEQSEPLPMNVLAIAPIINEQDK